MDWPLTLPYSTFKPTLFSSVHWPPTPPLNPPCSQASYSTFKPTLFTGLLLHL